MMNNSPLCVSDLILLSSGVEEKLAQLQQAGINYVELLVDGNAWDDTEAAYQRYLPYLQQTGMKYSVHPPAWDTNLTSENKVIREATYAEYLRAIQFASEINASHVVIHPGFCYSPGFNVKIAKQRALELVSRLCEEAKQLNVTLAVENVGYNGSSLFTQQEYVQFVAELDESAAYLIDTGHAHLNGWDIPALIKATKDRLTSIHLHDNFADGDRHLPIGSGSIVWEPIFEALQEAEYCAYILEYAPGTSFEQLHQSIDLLQSKWNVRFVP